MNKLFVFPTVLALAALSSTSAACPCLYTDDDPEDCLVYGQIDGELVPWMRATQECLDVYNIQISAPDPSSVCASSNGFVDSLRSGVLSMSSVKYSLGLSQMDGGFWAESGINDLPRGANNLPVIKDSITINGITTDCTPQSVEVDCYTAMKTYFENDADGQQEMANVCEKLETDARKVLEAEQSTLRYRLCIEDVQGTNIRQECDGLWAEVSKIIAENPDRECEFVSVGPETTLPGCDGGDGDGGDGDRGGDDGDGDSATQVRTVAIVAVASLYLMVTNMMVW